jgi:F5/8 type C domain-containing protein
VPAAALSLLVYTVITMVIGRDVLMHLGSAIANDPGDPLLTAAILKWNATHVPLTDAWYQFPIFYPTRDTLTFSEHLLGLSVIASPIYWLTGNLVITYNLVLLLTFPLCAMAMYALVYRLSGSAAGAFVAGLAFAFAPYRISQLPHIQMLATFWAPLALLGLHAYIETGRRHWLVLYAASWALQGASNGYALVMFSILVGLWTLWFVILRRQWHALAMIALATVIAVLPLAPVLYKYTSVHSHFGFERGYWEIRGFSADIAGLLCAPPMLTFWGWVRVKCGPEGELFPGVALMLLSTLGLVGMVVRSWRSESIHSGPLVTWFRRVLLFIAAVYGVVILVLLVSGPFMFELGPLRVQASTFRKPVQVVTLTVLLALVLSPGVRAMVRQSRMMWFYLLAAVVTWALALGPMTTFMGDPGIPGPYHLLMSLPGVDALRVPARFWLMTTICLSVLAGLVVSEFMRGRPRGTVAVAVVIVGLAVLSDGWIDRIRAADLPPAVPGADRLAGATVLEAPPDLVLRDIHSVYRAVNGGWRTVNGYSGWGPSYYSAFVGAGRAESADMLTPFQRLGDLHVVVGQDAPRLRAMIEQQPGVTRVASDHALIVYRLPARHGDGLPRPAGQQWQPRELRSPCSSGLLSKAMDHDETSLWQCALWDERQALTIDLGGGHTVGSVVNDLGAYSWLFPGALAVDTSEDGTLWTPAWSGTVLERTILAAMDDPKRLRIVVDFPPRQARYVRIRAASGGNDAPWAIAELEVWSASVKTR